jgi:hypothetical protein
MDIYITGRVPKTYISYYAAGDDSDTPADRPTLSENGNEIVETEGSSWSKTFSGSADANNFLYEITFIEYEAPDE